MANVYQARPGKFVISAVSTNILAAAGGPEFVGWYAVQLVATGFTGSITVKARAASKQATADGDNIAFAAWYYLLNTGVVATAALTASALIMIPASGMEIALDATTVTAGTVTVYAVPVKGAAD